MMEHNVSKEEVILLPGIIEYIPNHTQHTNEPVKSKK